MTLLDYVPAPSGTRRAAFSNPRCNPDLRPLFLVPAQEWEHSDDWLDRRINARGQLTPKADETTWEAYQELRSELWDRHMDDDRTEAEIINMFKP